VLGSFVSNLALRVVGSSALTAEDLAPALVDMKVSEPFEHLSNPLQSTKTCSSFSLAGAHCLQHKQAAAAERLAASRSELLDGPLEMFQHWKLSRLVGSSGLTAEDLAPALVDMKVGHSNLWVVTIAHDF
jgi:hypothetical protein